MSAAVPVTVTVPVPSPPIAATPSVATVKVPLDTLSVVVSALLSGSFTDTPAIEQEGVFDDALSRRHRIHRRIVRIRDAQRRRSDIADGRTVEQRPGDRARRARAEIRRVVAGGMELHRLKEGLIVGDQRRATQGQAVRTSS